MTRSDAKAGLGRAGSANRPGLFRAWRRLGHGRAGWCGSHELLRLIAPASRGGAADDGFARGGEVGCFALPTRVDLADASRHEIGTLVAGVARRLGQAPIERQFRTGDTIGVGVEPLDGAAVGARQRADEESRDSSRGTHAALLRHTSKVRLRCGSIELGAHRASIAHCVAPMRVDCGVLPHRIIRAPAELPVGGLFACALGDRETFELAPRLRTWTASSARSLQIGSAPVPPLDD